jgi:bacteriorhodopsin
MTLHLPPLTPEQYSLVYYFFLITAGIMVCCLVAQLFLSTKVMKWYRPAIYMSAFIVAASALHYLFIAMQWQGYYSLQDGTYLPSEQPFLQALYRYVYWLPTVPMLLVSLIVVLNFSKSYTRSLSIRLVAATVAMILLGYPGEISANMDVRMLWFFLSTLPFLYILYILWAELSITEQDQPTRVTRLVRAAKYLMAFAWAFFPVVYLVPLFGTVGSSVEVGLQIGYALADWVAKASYGFMIYAIAKAQSTEDVLYIQKQNQQKAVAVAASGD